MKKQLKIFILRIFFRCEIESSEYSVSRQQQRWTFKFHPRKVPATILMLILTPFIFIKAGYYGVVEFWGTAYNVDSCSSDEIWGGNKPSKSECYEKF